MELNVQAVVWIVAAVFLLLVVGWQLLTARLRHRWPFYPDGRWNP